MLDACLDPRLRVEADEQPGLLERAARTGDEGDLNGPPPLHRLEQGVPAVAAEAVRRALPQIAAALGGDEQVVTVALDDGRAVEPLTAVPRRHAGSLPRLRTA